jgi:hypothetical protein
MNHAVTATPCNGVNMPLSQYAVTLEVTDDLPPEVLGECVSDAVQKAWNAGFDPAVEPFLVIVTFT